MHFACNISWNCNKLWVTVKKFNGFIRYSQAVAQRCSWKRVFLEISQNSQENICARVSFFNKVAGLGHAFWFELKIVTCQISKPTNLKNYHASFWNKINEDTVANLTKKLGFEVVVLNNLYLWHKKRKLFTLR